MAGVTATSNGGGARTGDVARGNGQVHGRGNHAAGTTPPPQPSGAAGPSASPRGTLFDLAQVDLSARLLDRTGIEALNPHRGHMSLLDYVVWHSSDFKQGVGLKQLRSDEFWVPGHFPQRAMYPGVLMIESAAQLAVYLYNVVQAKPQISAFTRIEDACFRASAQPGDDLVLLCQVVKSHRRGFSCDVQGLVGGKTAFEARIQGLAIGERDC